MKDDKESSVEVEADKVERGDVVNEPLVDAHAVGSAEDEYEAVLVLHVDVVGEALGERVCGVEWDAEAHEVDESERRLEVEARALLLVEAEAQDDGTFDMLERAVLDDVGEALPVAHTETLVVTLRVAVVEPLETALPEVDSVLDAHPVEELEPVMTDTDADSEDTGVPETQPLPVALIVGCGDALVLGVCEVLAVFTPVVEDVGVTELDVLSEDE